MKSPQTDIEDASTVLRGLRDTMDAAARASHDARRLAAGSRRLIEESRQLLLRVDEIMMRRC